MGQKNKRLYTCPKCGVSELGQPNRKRPCSTCADGTVMVRSVVIEKTRKPLGRKYRKKDKFIQWGRKLLPNGRIKYIIVNGDFYWWEYVHEMTPRDHIAWVLRRARKKLRQLIDRGVRVGGK